MDARPDSYLAIDLGASTGRALLGTVDADRVEVEEVHRFETPMIEHGGRLFWDIEALEAEVLNALRLSSRMHAGLRSVSVDSWAVDYVPIGDDGSAIRNPYCYRDTRTKGMMEEALELVPREDIYQTTGIQFMPINTLYQILADHNLEPDLVAQTKLRLLIADYIQYRLCGRAVAEQSMASTTQLLNVRTKEWATDLMARFNIDPSTWPEIVTSSSRIGSWTGNDREINEAPGRSSGVDVIAGCSHDTACAVAAVPAGANAGSWAYISCGTWALLGVEREEPILSDRARDAGFTNELGIDGTVRFLKNLVGLWVLQECERAWRSEGQRFDHRTLRREARDASENVASVNLSDPRFAEPGGMPMKIQNYCRERGQPVPNHRGEFVRLILKNMVEDFRDTLRLLEDVIGERIERVHIVGGGAQDELLCQWTADAMDRSVVAGPAEATGLGNLLIQARTLGALPRGATIRDVVRTGSDLRTYEPVDLPGGTGARGQRESRASRNHP